MKSRTGDNSPRRRKGECRARKKKNGCWVVSFRDENGKGKTRGFGPGKEGMREARAFARQIEESRDTGEPTPQSSMEGVGLDELAIGWIAQRKMNGSGGTWLADWAHILDTYFIPAFERKAAHAITYNDIIRFMVKQYGDRAQSTRNRYLRYLKSIFAYGVKQKLIPANPLADWTPAKEPKQNSPLTLADLRKLQDVAVPHLAWAIEVAWNIPIRPGKADLYRLKFTDINWDAGYVQAWHTKVKRGGTIPLSEGFLKALEDRKPLHASGHLIEYGGQPVSSLKTAVKNAGKRAELAYWKSLCMYDIRHLWITTMIDKGVELSTIASMAGTSVRMLTERYYEHHGEDKRRAVEVIPSLGHVHKPGTTNGTTKRPEKANFCRTGNSMP